jgi:hypothetical protein
VTNRAIPICEGFHVPETGLFGFSFRFEGRPPHYTMDTYLQDALEACDGHGEHVWEDASDADEKRILISQSYKPGSVLDRLAQV